MSKVDEWLDKINETRNLTHVDFLFVDGMRAFIDSDDGPIKISFGEIMVRIEKEDAMKFGNWIIDNYGENNTNKREFWVELSDKEKPTFVSTYKPEDWVGTLVKVREI